MGRAGKPVKLMVLQGRTHLTKQQIEDRQKSEIKVGNNTLKMPAFLKKNKTATAKWKEIVRQYKAAEIDFVSSSDTGHLARYCMTFAEYNDLVERRAAVAVLDIDSEEAKEHLAKEVSERKTARILKVVEYLLSVNGIMAIDTAINKKMEMLIKMEDRLFLNPLAKVKNVPPKPKQEKEENRDDKEMFG